MVLERLAVDPCEHGAQPGTVDTVGGRLGHERPVPRRHRRRHAHRGGTRERVEPTHLGIDLSAGAAAGQPHPHHAAAAIGEIHAEHAVPVVRDERDICDVEVVGDERSLGDPPEALDLPVGSGIVVGAAHSITVWPAPSGTFAMTTFAAATSWTPSPVRSQTVSWSSLVRPGTRLAQISPSSIALSR